MDNKKTEKRLHTEINDRSFSEVAKKKKKYTTKNNSQENTNESKNKSLVEEQPKVKELIELITDCVKPDKKSSLNINVLHKTPLLGAKSKKQLSNKKPHKKKKTITRKRYADLGLYTLSRNSLKYIDLVPLHKLWKNYILEHLSLPLDTLEIPDVGTLFYDAYSKRLIKSDFHGAKITVSRSKCTSLVGIHGIIAMDTKNTFKILSKDNQLRTVPKEDSVFSIRIKNVEFTIFGKHLTIRPAERSVKKIKNCMELDL